MKTKNSIKNLMVAFVGQFLGIAITFVVRKVFVIYLNAEYLGIDGLFTKIITLLTISYIKEINPKYSKAVKNPSKL